MITFGLEAIASFGLSATRKRRLRARIVDGLEDAAEPVADEIRQAAPERSGALRESVRVERDDADLSVTIKAGDTPETARPTKGGITYDEALLTEYGTVNEPARPFFFPVIRAHRDDFEKVGGAAVDDALDGD